MNVLVNLRAYEYRMSTFRLHDIRNKIFEGVTKTLVIGTVPLVAVRYGSSYRRITVPQACCGTVLHKYQNRQFLAVFLPNLAKFKRFWRYFYRILLNLSVF